jgi:hypothetical protein
VPLWTAQILPRNLSEEILEKAEKKPDRQYFHRRNHDRRLHTIFNENAGKTVREAIEHLRAARGLNEKHSFQLYLTPRSRNLNPAPKSAPPADYHCVRTTAQSTS